MPLTQDQLDLMAARGCQVPGCTHAHALDDPVYLHAKCHRGAGLSAEYRFGNGTLRLSCKKCNRTVAEIVVADNTPEEKP